MITLREFFNDNGHRFWPSKSEQQKTYFKVVKSQILRFCEYKDHDSRGINEFKPQDFYNFMDHLKDQGSSDNTINRYLSSLQKIFGKAKSFELINHTPEVDWLPTEEGRVKVYTNSELQMILDYLGPRKEWMKCYVILGLHTGRRLGDIQKLNTETLSDCGTKFYVGKSKNGDPVEVLLNENAQIAAKRLLEINGNKFVHSTFRRVWNEMRAEFFRMGKISKPEEFVFHALRHTCASIMSNDMNISLGIVSKVLGHRNIKTTMKYVHAKSEVVSGVMDAIAQHHKNEGNLSHV